MTHQPTAGLNQILSTSLCKFPIEGQIGMWEDQEDGSLGSRKTPQQKGIPIKNRDHALHVLADGQLALPD